MILRRVWIALLLGSFTPALCQQSSTAPIALQVVDQTGAEIPQARIEVSTSEGHSLVSRESDAEGKADLQLPIGEFDLVIESQGFCPQKRSLKVLDLSLQNITAKLKVNSCPGPCQAFCVEVIGAPPMAPAAASPSLRVIVEDQAGVRIPLARIGVHSEKNGLEMEILANKWGEATLTLDPGKYGLTVGAQGFNTSSQAADLTTKTGRTIKITLTVANQCAGCLSVGEQEIDFDFVHAVPEEAIPTVPLEPLPLPSHKMRVSHSRTL